MDSVEISVAKFYIEKLVKDQQEELETKLKIDQEYLKAILKSLHNLKELIVHAV